MLSFVCLRKLGDLHCWQSSVPSLAPRFGGKSSSLASVKSFGNYVRGWGNAREKNQCLATDSFPNVLFYLDHVSFKVVSTFLISSTYEFPPVFMTEPRSETFMVSKAHIGLQLVPMWTESVSISIARNVLQNVVEQHTLDEEEASLIQGALSLTSHSPNVSGPERAMLWKVYFFIYIVTDLFDDARREDPFEYHGRMSPRDIRYWIRGPEFVEFRVLQAASVYIRDLHDILQASGHNFTELATWLQTAEDVLCREARVVEIEAVAQAFRLCLWPASAPIGG